MNVSKYFIHTAVHWAKSTLQGSGYTSYSTGVEISARWDLVRKLFTNANNEDQMSKAFVYMDGTTGISVDDKLYLGTLASLPSGADVNPNLERTAYRVAAVEDSASLSGSQSIKTAKL